MDQKRKLLIIGSIAGGVLLLGGWLFLLQSLLAKDSNKQDFQANIHGGPLSGDVASGALVLPNEQPVEEESPVPKKLEESPVSLPILPIEKSEVIAFEEIDILVPPFVSQDALQDLRKKIFQEYKVVGNIHSAKTWNGYKKLATQELEEHTYDILLLPSIWQEDFEDSGVHIPFPQPVEGLFHQVFHESLGNIHSTFIPFAIDPAVTLIHKDVDIDPSGTLTFGHIQNALIGEVSSRSYIPISFGISDIDRDFLQKYIVPYPHYYMLLDIILQQAAQAKNSYVFEYMQEKAPWDTRYFAAVLNDVKETHPLCTRLPSLCLVAQEKIGIFLGFSHHHEILTQDFSLQNNTYAVYNFPVYKDTDYPVITWSWLISKESEQLTESGQWMKGYLDHAMNSNIPLWDWTISAFNQVRTQQALQKRAHALHTFSQDWSALYGSLDDLQDTIDTSPLIDVLAGSYDTHIYLDILRK